ncbi:hypothetical protein BGZ79_009984 [Entomortierella chlamydospora]|nr:hypothetical protein BGZ79_009984 [Entomortierella chlamydospora]
MLPFTRRYNNNNDPNDPNNHFPNDVNRPSSVSHLEWNSQIGSTPQQHNQESRQGGERHQFEPYASFPFRDDINSPSPGQVQFIPVVGMAGSSSSSNSGGPPCRSRDRVYLPDMQSFLIKTPLTYQEAVQACSACGSELVLVDGTNVDRFKESFSSLGLYGDQKLWIKSWFGERVNGEGICPAVFVNAMMGNRLEPVEAESQNRFFALCY